MPAHDRRRLRALAAGTLVALGSTILSLLLTLAYPRFGVPQSYSGILYIPPQACLVGLLAPTTLGLAFAATISGLRISGRAGQLRWAGAFAAVLLLLVLSPGYLICSFATSWSVVLSSPLLPIPQKADTWWFLAAGSAVVLVVTAVCALAYASRAMSPNEPL